MFQDQDDFLMDGNDSAAVSSSRAEGDPLDPFSLLENVAHSHMCRESSVPRDTFMVSVMQHVFSRIHSPIKLDDPLMHSQLVHEEDPIFHDPSNDADFFPTLSLVGTKVSVEELEQEKPQKKKVVRKKGLQVDSATSLSVEDIRAMQAGSTLQKIRLSAVCFVYAAEEHNVNFFRIGSTSRRGMDLGESELSHHRCASLDLILA